MTAIRGHERRILIWACWELERFTCLSVTDSAERFGEGRPAAVTALSNPAALAEIISETLRGFGVNAYGPGVHEAPAPVFPCVDVTPFDNDIRVQVWRSYQDMLNDESGDHDMPTARALLLRLLQLPKGATTEDALQEVEAA